MSNEPLLPVDPHEQATVAINRFHDEDRAKYRRWLRVSGLAAQWEAERVKQIEQGVTAL